jgi:hypothetical protein
MSFSEERMLAIKGVCGGGAVSSAPGRHCQTSFFAL